MSRVVIVARTRMQGDHVCIGGHDLEHSFRGVRLLDRFGDHWTTASPFTVGELWNLDYRAKHSARPPHVEDVYVNGQQRMGQVPDLKGLVLRYARPWSGGPNVLFDGTVRSTPSRAAYIPPQGRLPRCSTGYWVPDNDLMLKRFGTKKRFLLTEQGDVERFAWVGVQEPPERIEAGSLVRVSLSRLFAAEGVPEGYYVQISGVL
jgi:hypothetical protein